jgi:hypothetical protein
MRGPYAAVHRALGVDPARATVHAMQRSAPMPWGPVVQEQGCGPSSFLIAVACPHRPNPAR